MDRDEIRPDLVLKAQVEAPAKQWVTLEQWKALAKRDREKLLLVEGDAKFNEQMTENIGWARWSYNPITGCKHDCPYCYARDIANRRYPQKFEPTLIPSRLAAPRKTMVPDRAKEDISYKNVFTGSMADMFGQWVPAEWIEAVLAAMRDNAQWNFLCLTKFPQRAVEFDLPPNLWMGTTVDAQVRVDNAERAFAKVKSGTKWLSCEPLLEPLKFKRLDLFDWIVIGGASKSTRTPAWVPPIDWIVDLHRQARDAGLATYYKTNCGMADSLRLQEFPWTKRQERVLPDAFRYLRGMEGGLEDRAGTPCADPGGGGCERSRT